jgi:alkyl sulfatase BDS1-like metallo-beta-lactamase superfamily hydrolase
MKPGIGLCLLLALPVLALADLRQAASEATTAANAAVGEALAFEDDEDFELSARGFIGTTSASEVVDANGDLVWSFDRSMVTAGDAQATVNPSLWRQATLNARHGLYEVADGIWQVRGFDLSNLSVIEGETGYIVVDPLITAEVAAAAMQLVFEHLPEKPVVAVIYSHSHADHFGGVEVVVDADDVAAGKVRIIAPEGFREYAVAENILAGNAMSRRAAYMYGALLPRDATGAVDSGLGRGISNGLITLIGPTEVISGDEHELVIDGVLFRFRNVPFAEAPSEMMFYLPDRKAFYAAEEANGTLHNLYTLRGAQVRDALLWSGYLRAAARQLEPETEVLFGGHHWPRWGHEQIVDYLVRQGDAYKYIHDQTLRLANHGHTPDEISERLELPPELARAWFNHGYYGTVSHNVRAVYQKYLGFFDGNPANLHPLPPEEAGRKYVEFMGGADAVLEKAREAYANAEYRWVAEVVNHRVFADPGNASARELQADALEQLGYRAESGPWRNVYLTGAMELRNGVNRSREMRTASPDMLAALSLEDIFDYLAVRLNGPAAAGRILRMDLEFVDSGDVFALTVANGVLQHDRGPHAEGADLTVTLTRRGLLAMTMLGTPVASLVDNEMLRVDGDAAELAGFIELLDGFDYWFDIVTP